MWKLFVLVLVSQSKAAELHFAGRQSDGVVIAVHCSGMGWRAAISHATDVMPDYVIVFSFRDHGPSDFNSPDDNQTEL